jgi:hypothetical protein
MATAVSVFIGSDSHNPGPEDEMSVSLPMNEISTLGSSVTVTIRSTLARVSRRRLFESRGELVGKIKELLS